MLGKTIAKKYKITARVGVGGMGSVYRAEHNVLGRQSAIKALHAQLNSDKTFIERFMREARAMARLDHDNIVRIYDVFEEAGLHYIAMELFEGPSLKAVIEDQGVLSLEQTVSIIGQCARGLAYAHAQGIVHRDIKPSNIMLNSEGRIKITDFGIAAAMDDAATLTNTGQLVGTPRYMSPEQAKNGNIDRRSDLYSLGIVFYELVTGHTPFDGDSGVAIIGKLAYESTELSLEFNDNVPDDMRELIRKMLLRHQDERIQHATHLMGELNKLSTKSNDLDNTVTSSLSLMPLAELDKNAHADVSDRTEILPRDSSFRPNVSSPSYPATSGSYPANVQITDSDKKYTYVAKKSKAIPIAVAAVFLLSVLGGIFYYRGGGDVADTVSHSQESTLAVLVQKDLTKLLEKKTSVELEMKQASDVNAQRLSGEKFGSASDKFLIAEGAVTAIERDINNKRYQQAKISISRANNVFESASLLFRKARQEVEDSVSSNIFAQADTQKKQTVLAARKLRNEKFSGAFSKNFQKAAGLTKQATRNYDKAKLQFEAQNISLAKKLLVDVQHDYSEAETIYTNLAGYVNGQEIIHKTYALRSKLNALETRIVTSKEKANNANAPKLALVLYNKATSQNSKLVKGKKETKRLLHEKDYNEAGFQFRELVKLANRVIKDYQASTQFALAHKPAPAKLKVQVARLKNKSPMVQASKPSQRDIVEVEQLLNQFKDAYEARNINQLQQMVELSPLRLQTAIAIFKQFSEIHLSVTSYSLVSGRGTADIRIDSAVTPKGDQVVPSQKWRHATLEILQDDDSKRWRKIVWR